MSLVEQALRRIQAQSKLAEADARARQPVPTVSAEVPPAAKAPTAPSAPAGGGLAMVAQREPVAIDQAKLRVSGLLSMVVHERALTRQLRAIKLSLLRKMSNDALSPQDVPRTVMVTSSRQGDGKTFSSFNLALSLAREKDLSVLLVDADVLKPQITTELGLAGEIGLIDVLADPRADIVDCVRPTQIRGLYFLPAGRSSDVATELLSSERMVSVIRQLVNLHPNLLVMFDSSPLLLTAEAQALAGLMSQILVVVRAGATPQAIVHQALELLERDAKKVGLILNDARDGDVPDYEYGSPYGRTPTASLEGSE